MDAEDPVTGFCLAFGPEENPFLEHCFHGGSLIGIALKKNPLRSLCVS